MRLGTVGDHGPNLALARACRFKDKVAAIGCPAGALVASLIAGQFAELLGSGVDDEKVVVIVRSSPAEGQQQAVGRPCGVDDVTFVRKVEFADTGAVGVHQIELGSAATVADKRDRLAGLGIPSGRHVGAVGMGKAFWVEAVYVTDVEFGVPLHGRRENKLRAIGRPGWRDVGPRKPREGDELTGFHGIHADLRVDDTLVWGIAGEGDARTVRRPPRREGNRMKTGELMLISTIIIHDPEFLVSVAGGADKSDLRGPDAGQAAGQFADDFVGKLVGIFANLQVCRTAA